MYIDEYIKAKIDEGLKAKDVADALGITPPMISKYKNDENGFNPSLTIAKRVYLLDGIVLHPFSEEALKIEIAKDRK